MVAGNEQNEQPGIFSPEFGRLNDDVLFGEVWARAGKLSLKLRSSVTISVLIGKRIPADFSDGDSLTMPMRSILSESPV
ncbi:MAG: hypothetical protein DBY44_07150 [Veillonellaceae bacterium]|nr:MAG: hypothetical protein DBY44_07150 [Veillonellaceae bacterium]